MSTKQVEFRFVPEVDQLPALKSTALEILIGGQAGGGKSYWLCCYAFLYAMKYPGVRIVLARRKLTLLLNSTWKTFLETVPKETYTFNSQRNTVKFLNGSEIILTGLDANEDLDRFSSTELALILIDQAEECLREHWEALITRLRQKLPDGTFPPYHIIASANPRIGYIRDKFILSPVPGKREFYPFRAKNNRHLPPDYHDRMKDALKDSPALYASLVEGSWDVTEEVNSLIKYKDLLFCASVGQQHLKAHVTRKGVSCDSARYGDDMTVIYEWHGTKITGAKFLRNMSVPAVASECVASCKSIGGNWIAIDTTSGLGAGSYDIIKQLTSDTTYLQIFAVNSSNASIDPKYLNVRAEMYFTLNTYVSSNIITLPNDPVLIADLAAQTYEYRIDKIKITSKDEIKKRLGRSPDRGDACAIGIYALDKLVQDHELTAGNNHYRDDRPLDYHREDERVSYDNQSPYEVDELPDIQ